MGRLGDLAAHYLFEGVDSLAGLVEGVHEMHSGVARQHEFARMFRE